MISTHSVGAGGLLLVPDPEATPAAPPPGGGSLLFISTAGYQCILKSILNYDDWRKLITTGNCGWDGANGVGTYSSAAAVE